MLQTISWGSNGSSAGIGIPLLAWNPAVQHHIHGNPLLVHTTCQRKPVSALTSCLFITLF
jgi:hypothetical protein